MSIIKAIETKYKGYKFRSRLEAKWAVFFDNAKIKYEYEPEGYEDENGKRYLPDFYLPEFDAHVEVKRNTKDGIDEIKSKCLDAIQWGGAIKQIIVLSDIPEGKSVDGGMWHFPVIFWCANDVSWGWWFFFDCDKSKFVWGQLSSANYTYAAAWICENNSIGPVSDYELRRNIFPWNRDEKLRKIENLLGLSTELSLEEHIAIQEQVNHLTFESFSKAREARFEFNGKA
jgi:hypothetical protein